MYHQYLLKTDLRPWKINACETIFELEKQSESASQL